MVRSNFFRTCFGKRKGMCTARRISGFRSTLICRSSWVDIGCHPPILLPVPQIIIYALKQSLVSEHSCFFFSSLSPHFLRSTVGVVFFKVLRSKPSDLAGWMREGKALPFGAPLPSGRRRGSEILQACCAAHAPAPQESLHAQGPGSD